jgi:hypothetical protein
MGIKNIHAPRRGQTAKGIRQPMGERVKVAGADAAAITRPFLPNEKWLVAEQLSRLADAAHAEGNLLKEAKLRGRVNALRASPAPQGGV